MLLMSPVGLLRSGTRCKKNECVPEVFGIVKVAVPFPLLVIDAPPKPPTSAAVLLQSAVNGFATVSQYASKVPYLRCL
jgi:hypothetical protein